MKVAVLIPTYNEKDNILRLLDQIFLQTRKLKGYKFEVLIVDDDSPDGTAQRVREYARRRRSVNLLVRTKKEGLGAAYLSGMKHAFSKLKAETVLVIDADLSHDPRYIPHFLQTLKASDMVIGSRYIKGGSIPKNWALHRKVYSIFGNKVTSLVLGEPRISDWTSGYRAIRRKVYKKVVPLMQKKELRGYTFNISFVYFALKFGFRVFHTPIKFLDRTSGKSKLGLEYLYHTPIFLFKTRLREILHI